MINSKETYKLFLMCDKKALGISKIKPSIFGDEIWKFEILLRKAEYYKNTKKKNLLKKILYYITMYRFHKARVKLGFSIPLNVFGPGLSIAHRGTIIVNGNAKIGKNCRIQECTTIGATNGESSAPVLGNNIFIGSGARIIGNIKIADDIAIGANAVVNKNFDTPGITIAGVPAKKVSNNNSHSNLCKELFLEESYNSKIKL